jgi:hypothetical protein
LPESAARLKSENASWIRSVNLQIEWHGERFVKTKTFDHHGVWVENFGPRSRMHITAQFQIVNIFLALSPTLEVEYMP